MPKSALPPHLRNRKHEDYFFPFSLIPRSWTAFKLYPPPVRLFGNQAKRIKQPGGFYCPNPVPYKGTWGIQGIKLTKWLPYLPLYFTITLHKKWNYYHFSIGVRFDTVDNYFQIPRLALYSERSDYE